MGPRRFSFTATLDWLEDGFFVPTDSMPTSETRGRFRIIGLEGVSEPVQFFRLRVEPESSDEPSCSLLVISAHFPQFSDARIEQLRATFTRSEGAYAACFTIADRTGWARARAAVGVPREVTAAAVAVVKFAASWDESDPQRIDVDGVEFAVSVCFDGRHRARVSLAT